MYLHEITEHIKLACEQSREPVSDKLRVYVHVVTDGVGTVHDVVSVSPGGTKEPYVVLSLGKEAKHMIQPGHCIDCGTDMELVADADCDFLAGICDACGARRAERAGYQWDEHKGCYEKKEEDNKNG